MVKNNKKWIQLVKPKKGALHKQLGYPADKPIPTSMLKQIENANLGDYVKDNKVTHLLKRRAIFALNVRR